MNGQLDAIPVLQGRVERAICPFAARYLPLLSGAENLLLFKKEFFKKRDLEKELNRLGWWLKRQGSSHEIWTNGEDTEPIPRHREIKENLARKIVEVARKNPPKKK